jgi:hypothetical protein
MIKRQMEKMNLIKLRGNYIKCNVSYEKVYGRGTAGKI